MENIMDTRTWNILMVDDDEDDYLLTQEMLCEAQYGKYNLSWARSYEDGWSKIQEDVYDAVLIDYDLGPKNGLQLIRRAVANKYDLTIILFTGRGSYEVDLQAMQAGAALYLAKSEVNPLLLERSIRYAIERKQSEILLRKANQEMARLNQDLQEELAWREQAERELRESERQQRDLVEALEAERLRLNTILENIPVGIWIADPTGRLTSKNEQAVRIRGGNASLLDGIDHYSNYPVWSAESGEELLPDDYPMSKTLRTGQPVGPVELNVRRFDGTFGTALLSVAPIKVKSGAVEGAVEITFDITQRKQSEDALRASEQRYLTLFNAGTNGIAHCQVITDENGQPIDYEILQVNKAYEQIIGISKQDIEGRRIRDVFPGIENFSFDYIGNYGRVALEGGELNFEVFFEATSQWLSIYIYSPKHGEFTAIFTDITPRKQFEVERERLLEENRQQREFLERLIQKVPVAIAVLQGPEHRYTITNPHEEYLTRGKGNLVGRTVAEVWSEGPEQVLPILEHVYQTGEPFSAHDISFDMIRDSGLEKAYFDVSYTPLYDQQSQVEGILALAIETTEQVAKRREIEKQKNLLQAIFDHAPVGIAVLEGPDLTYLMANQNYMDILGKADLPLVGHTVEEMFPEAAAAGGLKYIQSVLETGQANSLSEFSVQTTPEGRETWWQVEHIPLLDEHGQVHQVLIISLEITDQVTARLAVEAEQARLMTVINSAPAGIVVTDEKARILMTNELANQLYARPVPLLQDFDSHARLHLCYADGTPYKPRDLPLTRSALDGKTYTDLEMLIVWPDGQHRPLLVNTAPVRDAQECVTGAVGVFQDISRLKQAEADLEHYMQRLEQSNQELQEFANIAAHDMDEPLRKIRSFSGLLQNKVGSKLDAEERDYLQRMSDAAERMAHLLNALLDYSRVSNKTKSSELVDLRQIMVEVLQDLELQIQKSGGQVEVGEMPLIEAEPTQMHHLFQNLIGNALKFSRPGIPPQVKVSSHLLEHQSPCDPQMVEIRIEDNGIGFDPKAAGKLFLPFQRLVGRSQYIGNGMGLAICRKIVERHGGTITAQAEPGQGATFMVRIPLK
jgi:PAS domain S-box-containing protein